MQFKGRDITAMDYFERIPLLRDLRFSRSTGCRTGRVLQIGFPCESRINTAGFPHLHRYLPLFYRVYAAIRESSQLFTTWGASGRRTVRLDVMGLLLLVWPAAKFLLPLLIDIRLILLVVFWRHTRFSLMFPNSWLVCGPAWRFCLVRSVRAFSFTPRISEGFRSGRLGASQPGTFRVPEVGFPRKWGQFIGGRRGGGRERYLSSWKGFNIANLSRFW